jgi:hypothetical protein
MSLPKKGLSLLLVLVLLFSMSSSAVAADEKTKMDDLDKVLIAQRFLSSNEEDTNMWKGVSSVKDIVELYDIDNNVIAYYVSFNPKGYAIVNNNLDNPIALEFGEGDSKPIRKLLDKDKGEKIYYAGPGYSFNWDDIMSGKTEAEKDEIKEDLKLDKIYNKLAEKNKQEKELHKARKKLAKEKIEDIGGSAINGYDFILIGSMPMTTYTHDSISFFGTDWTKMIYYKYIAKDHCGATAATNIALYYTQDGYTNLKKNNSTYDTFVDLHSRIGNGPVSQFSSDLMSYAYSRGYSMTYSNINFFSGLKTATADDHPCGVLVANSPLDMHWVVSVGWREYNTGSEYIRIVTGWDDSSNAANYFSLWGDPLVMSVTEYEL